MSPPNPLAANSVSIKKNLNNKVSNSQYLIMSAQTKSSSILNPRNIPRPGTTQRNTQTLDVPFESLQTLLAKGNSGAILSNELRSISNAPYLQA